MTHYNQQRALIYAGALCMHWIVQSHIRYGVMTQPKGSLLYAYLLYLLTYLQLAKFWYYHCKKVHGYYFPWPLRAAVHVPRKRPTSSTLSFSASSQIPGLLPGQPLLLVSSHFLRYTVIKQLH